MQDAIETAILILGAPRSGTTWLAKIFDSHPGVLYRHEPDEVVATPPDPAPADIRGIVTNWLRARDIRTTTKRPFFAKSFQPAPQRWLRIALAYALNAADRLPEPARGLSRLDMPDLAQVGRARLTFKSVRWCQGAGAFARALPASRTVFIIRHPCGQVASVMRGNRQQRFDLREAGTDMPFDEVQAVAWAAAHGVDEAAFQALPDAGKYAWSWRAFNELAMAGLDGQPNARAVQYETLCEAPEATARGLFGFAGLDWHSQTADFVARSTSHSGRAGYYAVFRNAVAAANAWRNSMTAGDQAAVRAVVAGSPLVARWPRLLA
jgi:hypothetical protein